MILLADYNPEGWARLLHRSLDEDGWLAICELNVVTFRMIDLPTDSDDRMVWRTAQARGMVLFTANRRMDWSRFPGAGSA